MDGKAPLFISRAGSDEAIAARIGRCLEGAGYPVILQQWDFANLNFVDRMHTIIASDARVVALLSPAYLESDYCSAEWQNAIAADPLNRNRRLIVFRVAPCETVGLLAGIAYWDLTPLLGDERAFSDLVLRAVSPPERGSAATSALREPPTTRGLPTGTLTFLFTETEGGVERWERDRAQMQAAVSRNGAILNAAIHAHGGRVFRGGDAYAAVFRTAADAVGAALDAQRTLALGPDSGSDWPKVRIALHTGAADIFGDEYIGPAINRGARLVAICQAGQVLVSSACAELLAGSMPASTSLVDLGRHRLKDLVAPEHVYQLAADGLPAEFEPLRTIEGLPNNLPLQLTPLIGRDDVVADVRALVEQHRLVTLVGPGGVGKTRVALQVAAEMLDGSGEGVWLIDLAPLSDGSRVAETIALTLGIRETGGDTVRQTMMQYLKIRTMLLVFDNCEHVVAGAADLAAEIVRNCPGVNILATSREALNVGGERSYQTQPLAVPPAAAAVGAAEALSYGAVAWFAERAKLSGAPFALSDENAGVVADICRRLDGIPLAIELAAARVNVLSVAEVSRRIDQRLKFLRGGSREAVARQKTLRDLIDWSHDLLSEDEKTVFRRLAIFAGGCTLEAAEAVCAGDAIDESDVFDILTSLVAKSLVVADLQQTAERFRFLETMREYATEKLRSSLEEPLVARRRADWAAAFADRFYRASWASPEPDWLSVTLPDLENIRQAFNWAMGVQRDLDTAGTIAGGFAALWQVRDLGEGLRAIERVLDGWTASNSPKTEALLWLGLASMSVAKRKAEAAQRAELLYESLGDRAGLANALRLRAEGLRQMQQLTEAEEAAVKSLALFRELGLQNSLYFPMLLQIYGSVLIDCGRSDEARPHLDEALRRLEGIGDRGAAAGVEGQLAELEFSAGNVERALFLAEKALRTLTALGDLIGQAAVACNASAYHLTAGHVDKARALALQGLELALAADAALFLIVALQHLGTVAAVSGDARRGALLLSYVDGWFKKEAWEREFTEQHGYDLAMAAVRSALPEIELAAIAARAADLTRDEAIAEARAT